MYLDFFWAFLGLHTYFLSLKLSREYLFAEIFYFLFDSHGNSFFSSRVGRQTSLGLLHCVTNPNSMGFYGPWSILSKIQVNLESSWALLRHLQTLSSSYVMSSLFRSSFLVSFGILLGTLSSFAQGFLVGTGKLISSFLLNCVVHCSSFLLVLTFASSSFHLWAHFSSFIAKSWK